MSFSIDWDDSFENSPAGSDLVSEGDDRFRELKKAIRERVKSGWWDESYTPTYISATQFSLPYSCEDIYKGVTIKAICGPSEHESSVTAASYSGGVTTITIADAVLDSSLSKVYIGSRGGGGATSFLSLSDVDETSYAGKAGNSVVVNSTEDGLVFGSGSGSPWAQSTGGIYYDGGKVVVGTSTFDANDIWKMYVYNEADGDGVDTIGLRVDTHRTGNSAAEGMACYYHADNIHSGFDIGQTVYTWADAGDGGSLFGQWIVTASPKVSYTGAVGCCEFNTIERYADLGKQIAYGSGSHWTYGISIIPTDMEVNGEGTVGYDITFGLVLSHGGSAPVKMHTGIHVDLDSVSPHGTDICLRGGSTAALAPDYAIDIRDSFVVGIDFSNCTITGSGSGVINLNDNQAIIFGGKSLWGDSTGIRVNAPFQAGNGIDVTGPESYGYTMRVTGTHTVGIDFHTATITASSKAALWLADNQAILLGGYSLWSSGSDLRVNNTFTVNSGDLKIESSGHNLDLVNRNNRVVCGSDMLLYEDTNGNCAVGNNMRCIVGYGGGIQISPYQTGTTSRLEGRLVYYDTTNAITVSGTTYYPLYVSA